MRVLTEFAEDSVGYISHTGLDREEGRRNTSGFHLCFEEHSYVLTDFRRGSIYRSESSNLVRTVGLDNSRDLSGIDLDMIRAAAVGWFIDGDLATCGRIERLVEVVHTTHGTSRSAPQ